MKRKKTTGLLYELGNKQIKRFVQTTKKKGGAALP